MSHLYIKLLAVVCALCVKPAFADEPGCTLPQDSNNVKSAISNDACSTPMQIDHGVVEFVDGKPLLNMASMVRLERDLKKLRDGDKGNGMISYNGQPYTLKQMVILEQESSIDKDMLNAALAKFEELSSGYLQEARGFKSVMVSIINKWASQRNKVNSILLQWGSQKDGSEHEQLRKLVGSCVVLDQFVSELSCFLMDMRFSCKKSWHEFQEMVKKQKQAQASHK